MGFEREDFMRRTIVLLGVALIAVSGLAVASDAEQREAFVIAGSHVAAEYPPAALAAGFEGSVTVAGVIYEDGTVGAVEVIDSSSPKLGFEQSALDAFRQWEFAPAVQDGEPVFSVWAYDFYFSSTAGRLRPTGYVSGAYLASILGSPGVSTKDGSSRPGIDPTAIKRKVRFTKLGKIPCRELGCMYDRTGLLPKPQRYPGNTPPPSKPGG